MPQDGDQRTAFLSLEKENRKLKQLAQIFGMAWLNIAAVYLLVGVAGGMSLFITVSFIKARIGFNKDIA